MATDAPFPDKRWLYHREDPDIFVVGSNFGQSGYPGRTTNLLANPTVWVNIDGTEIEATTALVEGSDKSRIYDEFETMVDVYRVHKGRTSRDMRIVRSSAV